MSAQATAIAALIGGYRFRFDSELQLQDRIAELLTQTGMKHSREVILSKADRIDFLVGQVGIEIKIDLPTSSVLRQLYRYAQAERVSAMVLVTNRSKHLNIPREMNGKPVEVVFLGANL